MVDGACRMPDAGKPNYQRDTQNWVTKKNVGKLVKQVRDTCKHTEGHVDRQDLVSK